MMFVKFHHYLLVVCMTANVLELISAENVTVAAQRSAKLPNNLSLEHVMRFAQSSKTKLGVFYDEVLQMDTTGTTLPRDCQEVLERGCGVSGVYEIQPKNSPKPIKVLCDMDTQCGGWTTIQKRFDGSQDFLLGWRDYKFGFGDLNGEFWLGLENIHYLTTPVSELLVELVDIKQKKGFANYKKFSIGPETDGYPLNVVAGYSGDAGDSMIYHLGQKFTTIDFDQDKYAKGNCAVRLTGAWWYNACLHSNPNGKYINVKNPPNEPEQGLWWYTFRQDYPLAKSRLLVKFSS